MRVLIATNPFFGHFTPMVPLARALQERGHDVLIASEPQFASVVEGHGLRPVGVGRDLTVDDMLAAVPDIFDVLPQDQDAYARPRIFVELRAHNVFDDLDALVRKWAPDVVIRESGEFASWAIAESLSLPHLTVNVGAGSSVQVSDALMGPWFRELGKRAGIADLTAASLYRYGLFSYEPFGYYDWDSDLAVVKFRPDPVTVADSLGELGEALAALEDRPLVYATLGTEFFNADVMTAIISGLVDGDWNVLVATGNQADPATIDPRAPNVIVSNWVPQDAVLDRAAAVVTHGGAGTVTSCLVRGVPVVCVPQGADQFEHARRVVELELGVNLAPDQRSPEEIAAAVARVLADPGYRARGAQLAADTARLPGARESAIHVEKLVASLAA